MVVKGEAHLGGIGIHGSEVVRGKAHLGGVGQNRTGLQRGCHKITHATFSETVARRIRSAGPHARCLTAGRDDVLIVGAVVEPWPSRPEL